MENTIPDVFLPVKDYIVHLEDFDLVKIIGRGSYGEVYYAIHKTTGTKTALKKLLLEELDEVQLEYFIREVLILAYYNNFFLVSFLGFSPTNPYLIVTEFVPCGSLYDSLHGKPGSPILSGTDKTKIAIGIIEGMICLHINKIIHRDLKSLNILLDEHKLPKICDFGISRAIDDENQIKMTLRIGTYHWMAPEMLDSDDYSYKVDVYAFSIMLWEMITSKVPYQGQDPLKILINVKNNGMRPPIPSDCNEDLVKLMVRCWDQDPDNRPSFCELYEIFRDQNVHFNDTNPDEVRQFFEQFPISDEILHFKTTANNNDIINEESKVTTPETANKEEVSKEEANVNNELNGEDIKYEDIKYEDMNNDIDLNDMNNDINDDIDASPATQVINDRTNKFNFNAEKGKDSNHDEVEIASASNKEFNLASDHYMTQQRKTQESLINYNLHQENMLNTTDNSSVESLKDKDKKKDKKKDKMSKNEEKVKSKNEKEKKKDEKKKRKTDSVLNSVNDQNLRRMNSNTTFGKKLNEEYPDIKRYSPKNQVKIAPILPNKHKAPIRSFDTIYDIEIKEMKKRKIPINPWLSGNIEIHHQQKRLDGNIYSKFVNSIEGEKQKLPYFIPLHDFERSKNQIYTSDKNNIFLNPNRFPTEDASLSNETESFVIDDDVFKNYFNSSRNSKRPSRITTTPTSSSSKKYNLYIESNGKTASEEEEINEGDNIEDMLRQSSGNGKLINIFKAELDEMTIDNSIEVFNDLKNLLHQRIKTNDDRKKDDVYIFHLANAFKDKGELINQFNDINGFNMLPITGNPLITPSFITLFAVNILYDMKRFPFNIFNDIFIKDSYRNTRNFLLILQALDTSIQNNIFNDVRDRLKLKDVFIKLLNHFFDNKKYYQEFYEFPQFLFNIHSRIISTKGIFPDDFLLFFRYHLIDISNNIITSSTDLKCLKTAYSILLSKQVDAIKLFESQNPKKFRLPLRSILSHIAPSIKQPKTADYPKSELISYVSSLFAQFQHPPISSTLVTSLSEGVLFCTEKSIQSSTLISAASAACLTLCRIARTEKGAFMLSEKSSSWMEPFIREVDHVYLRLDEIRDRLKSGDNSTEAKSELSKELQNIPLISKRSSFCTRIMMTIFASHVAAIDNISGQNFFWRFLDSVIKASHLYSLYNHNSTDETSTTNCFSPLEESLMAVYAIIRRIKAKFVSAEKLNDSKILTDISKKILSRKIVHKSNKAAELALQIVDLLVREAAIYNQEFKNGLAPDLEFIDDFVNKLPSLLVIGGAVSHKAIIASISVFILQPNSTRIALKNEPNIRSISSMSPEELSNDLELENCNDISNVIQKILQKIELIGGFDKYRVVLLDILTKKC